MPECPQCVIDTADCGSVTRVKHPAYCLLIDAEAARECRWIDDQGRVQLAEFAPGYKSFIETMAEWYDQGYFHPDTFIKHDDTEIIKRGNVGIFAGWYSRITVNVQRLIAAGGFDKEYVFSTPLQSANGPAATNFVSLTAAIMISKESPDPEAAMKLLNWQFDTSNPENAATAEYGVKGIDWEWADPQNPYYIQRLSQDYVSEFMVSTSLPISILYAPDSEDLKKHYLHMKDYQYSYDFGKMPFDYYVPYDFKAAQDNVGAWNDITRMLSEEQVKFIMGIRPMAEWDDFLNELKKAGYDKVSAEAAAAESTSFHSHTRSSRRSGGDDRSQDDASGPVAENRDDRYYDSTNTVRVSVYSEVLRTWRSAGRDQGIAWCRSHR